jgi:exopolysaccharide biosynthesis WecB/TagA/CpsF family protein
MAEQLRFSVFFYGSTEKVLEKLKCKIFQQCPNLRIAGSLSPPYRLLTNEEKIEILKKINDASPDILFVGLGAPKQEKWMMDMCPRLEVPISFGAGAGFDFNSGGKKQAPLWMQKNGLEWLFRLCCEPNRLWKRYLFFNPLYVIFNLGYIGKKILSGDKKMKADIGIRKID